MINTEFQSLTALDHPLICELLEVYYDKNFVYFVYPFYTGGEIHDLIYDNETNDIQPLTEEELKPIMYQVLRSLNYLKFNQIFHRDLKPENIMFECFD
jgi:serine/threonine protein kinase